MTWPVLAMDAVVPPPVATMPPVPATRWMKPLPAARAVPAVLFRTMLPGPSAAWTATTPAPGVAPAKVIVPTSVGSPKVTTAPAAVRIWANSALLRARPPVGLAPTLMSSPGWAVRITAPPAVATTTAGLLLVSMAMPLPRRVMSLLLGSSDITVAPAAIVKVPPPLLAVPSALTPAAREIVPARVFSTAFPATVSAPAARRSTLALTGLPVTALGSEVARLFTVMVSALAVMLPRMPAALVMGPRVSASPARFAWSGTMFINW